MHNVSIHATSTPQEPQCYYYGPDAQEQINDEALMTETQPTHPHLFSCCSVHFNPITDGAATPEQKARIGPHQSELILPKWSYEMHQYGSSH